MGWLKLDADIFEHPKTLDLADLWGEDTITTVGMLVRFWTWCMKFTSTGLIEANRVNRINTLLGASHAASHAASQPASLTAYNRFAGLVDAGFVDVVQDGALYRIHGWWEHMGEWLQRRYNRTPEKWRSLRDSYLASNAASQPASQPASHAASHTASPKEERRGEDRTGEEKKKQKSRVFTPPTPDQIAAYCVESNITIDHTRFLDYYTANGWKVGRNAMKDWKAAVRNWHRNDQNRTGATHENPKSRQPLRSTQGPGPAISEIDASAPLLNLSTAHGG